LNAADPVLIRPIASSDDAAMADVIRAVMPEFGANGPGFAINDPEVDALSVAYGQPRAAYYVLDRNGTVLGGAGIAPLEGGANETCELRKMYVLPEARGFGHGRRLLERCLVSARQFGYRRCYLETLTGMDAAMKLYTQTGFKALPAPLGKTGHFACDRYYAIDL
jgi:putative acetyltransferase